ncbi:MAG: hypothetical protein IKD72_09200 [Clostridia bacterium]|nr:hypothetical protein [Clostridia bacterium]
MTLSNLNEKLTEIRKQKEQTLAAFNQAQANYNALCGAEQMLLQLIEEDRAQTAPEGAEADGHQS